LQAELPIISGQPFAKTSDKVTVAAGDILKPVIGFFIGATTSFFGS
jgi:hypothetical protein